MFHYELAEQLRDHLNQNQKDWSDNGVLAKVELDPELCLLREYGVYIIPDFVQYNIEGSGTRARSGRHSVNETLFCSLIVSKVFEHLRSEHSDGVANWDEVVPIIKMRHKAERVLCSFGSPTLTLTDVEPQPLVEEELENRNFIAITTFGFNQVVCV